MSVVSSSPILSPSSGRLSSNSSTNLPLFSTSFTKPISQKRYPLIVFSYKSGTGLTSEDKKELLKRYGLDPDEFLSEPSPKTRRRKEGRGSKLVVSDEKSQEERTTHRLLQVLGGKARRKKLLSPKGMDVRPMMEVVKGAAFDILQVHFVEMDPWVVSNVLTPNLEWTGFLDVSSIHTVRVETFLERAEQFVGKDGPFDYMSVTPPYTAVDYEVLMAQISKSALVGKDSFIVVEYPLRTDMLDTCGCLVKIKDRRFGRTHLAIYGPDWAQKKRKSEKKIPIVT
ncbi:methyltransferase [Citrus sinensis]|uniref:Methyltransferase n=1 Tax=Citrus sinensis TaxID=2711 RepID=A0ACB8K4V9_CITSI|nr:methyltransferase [Citrus sinensis]